MNLTFALAQTLEALSSGRSYGFDIIEATGLPSGTVYPLLRRLERKKMIAGRMENTARAHEAGRPPRRNYQLTPLGREALARCRERFGHVLRMGARTGDISARPAR